MAGGQAGVVYNNTVYTVTVTVTDDGSGQLSAAITGDSVTGRDLDFVNRYEAAPTEVHFAGIKTLQGRELAAEEFSFTLSDENGVIETVRNMEDGRIHFTALTYTKAGVYSYTVREDPTTEAGVTIDERVYHITVTVVDDGSGQLMPIISGDTTTGSDLNFVNICEAAATEEPETEEPEQTTPTEEPEQDDLTEETAVEEPAAEEATATVLTESGEVPIITSPDDEPTGEYYIDDMGVPRVLYVNKDGEEYYLDDNDVPRAAWRLPKTGYGPNLDWLLIAVGGLSLSVMLAALYKKKKNHGK